MKNIKEKVDTLISVIELTENKIGLETLKEIQKELQTCRPCFYKAISSKTNEEVVGNLINVRARHFIVSPFDDPQDITPICVFADSIKVQ